MATVFCGILLGLYFYWQSRTSCNFLCHQRYDLLQLIDKEKEDCMYPAEYSEKTQIDGSLAVDTHLPAPILSDDNRPEPECIESFTPIATGFALVSIFTYPLVNILDAMGYRMGISEFTLSFLFMPFITNGSVLATCISFGKQKTCSTTTSALQVVYGCAVMNNTMVLGSLCIILITSSKMIVWQYTDETLVVIVVQSIVAIMSFSKEQTLLTACFVVSLYPLSLVAILALDGSL